MKIGLYSPYLPDSFGGGERHFLTTAWYLAQKNDVEILVPLASKNLAEKKQKYEELFGLDLSKVNFAPSHLGLSPSVRQKWLITSKYNVFFYLTDGSLFLSGARKNILHIQVPFPALHQSVVARLKLRNWSVKNANSLFTKKVVEKNWKTKIPFIHYPYVLPKKPIHLGRKTFDIITVGRFIDPDHATLQYKNQELLVKAFIKGREQGYFERSHLHVVGTVENGEVHQKYLESLKKIAQGYPITFHVGVSLDELNKLLDRSLVFWHAAGFGVNENTQPERVEHFGMSVIEGMNSSCIPVIPEKGGLREIIQQRNKQGFFFASEKELIDKTYKIMTSSKDIQQELISAAHARAQDFSLDNFCQVVDEMIAA